MRDYTPVPNVPQPETLDAGPAARPSGGRLGLMLLVLGWAIAVGIGLVVLWQYEATPGELETPPVQWPSTSRIARNGEGATLLMFVHPRCPCSRASIGELARIIARCRGNVTAHVLFYVPRTFPEFWEKTDLWESAQRIPGVQVSADREGVETRLFRAQTSGVVVLYDADARLVFHGGITGSRGHYGDNSGSSAILAAVNGGPPLRKRTFVFGCPLIGDGEPPQEERRSCCPK